MYATRDGSVDLVIVVVDTDSFLPESKKGPTGASCQSSIHDAQCT